MATVKFRIRPLLASLSLGLIVVCCLGSSAFAVLATAVSVAAPGGAAVDSSVGDIWTVAAIGGGASDSHADSTMNSLSPPSPPPGPSSGINDSDGNAWGITSDGFSLVTATATFSSALKSGDFLSIDFDNGGLAVGAHAEVRFLDGSNTVQASLFAIGGVPRYMLLDASGLFDTGFAVTADGFNIKFDQMASGMFGLTLNPPVGSSVSLTSRTLAGGAAASVEKIQIYNQGAGAAPLNTVFFNNLFVDGAEVMAVPEASTLIGIPLALSIMAGVVAIRRRQTSLAG